MNTKHTGLRDMTDGLAYRARYYFSLLSGKRWEKVFGSSLESWEKASPASFKAAQKVFGRKPETPPTDPLPPFGTSVEVDGIRMTVDERMSEHNIRKLMRGRHTRHERDLLGSVLQPTDRVLELGAGIGMLGIFCSKIVGSENVVSVEANAQIESLAKKNHTLNGVSPDYRVCMVGPAEGERSFNISARFSRSSVFDTEEVVDTVKVPVVPFNALKEEVAPTVLVVDIQGGEAELFGYADLAGLRLVLVEVHPDMIGVGAVVRVRKQLAAQGFRLKSEAGNSLLYERISV